MKHSMKRLIRKRIWPLLVSLGSAAVMLLAFFIPSIQDQWDRYESRRIIQQYVQIGDDFVTEQNYAMAEQAFNRAFELSEERRLDIDVKRLGAKVNMIYQDPVWGSKPPEGLAEVDFQFLLHMQKGPGQDHARASILTSYGIYLASLGRKAEAERSLNEALRLNPNETQAHINLGNLLDDTGRKDEALKQYQRAIVLEPGNVRAHYNLGLLLQERGETEAASQEFLKTLQLDPHDADARQQLDLVRLKQAP
ncbi:tetratricopeptide repeat protein [Chryseolinea lacunae]|uniref:Tetratricopeptide repeat protein n=1 Tax=Chryseolinea lacunae TaxID=2801331 RepID=A0ABS1KTW7_9BACT|nr:tetratricopeptide repeat protein [Chryseolinea lacunae]MBL0742712.1 tetratricopeptide repeat protein [Chryseolinea lacunae]